MKKIYQIVFLLLFINIKAFCQSNIYFQLGYGYLEHLSTGIGCRFKDNHRIFLSYGSNFYINTKEFSSIQLQYEYPNKIPNKFKLNYGIKGGYSIYSNNYYRWRLITLTPILNFNLKLSDKLIFVSTIGLTYSRAIEMKRLANGEIGWYKEFLPELKFSMIYDL